MIINKMQHKTQQDNVKMIVGAEDCFYESKDSFYESKDSFYKSKDSFYKSKDSFYKPKDSLLSNSGHDQRVDNRSSERSDWQRIEPEGKRWKSGLNIFIRSIMSTGSKITEFDNEDEESCLRMIEKYASAIIFCRPICGGMNEFYMKAVKINPLSFRFIKKQTKEMCKVAIELEPELWSYSNHDVWDEMVYTYPEIIGYQNILFEKSNIVDPKLAMCLSSPKYKPLRVVMSDYTKCLISWWLCAMPLRVGPHVVFYFE